MTTNTTCCFHGFCTSGPRDQQDVDPGPCTAQNNPILELHARTRMCLHTRSILGRGSSSRSSPSKKKLFSACTHILNFFSHVQSRLSALALGALSPDLNPDPLEKKHNDDFSRTCGPECCNCHFRTRPIQSQWHFFLSSAIH